MLPTPVQITMYTTLIRRILSNVPRRIAYSTEILGSEPIEPLSVGSCPFGKVPLSRQPARTLCYCYSRMSNGGSCTCTYCKQQLQTEISTLVNAEFYKFLSQGKIKKEKKNNK